MYKPFKSEDEIEAVVRGLESCSRARDDFTHREHLTVAVWYLRNSDGEAALEKMRTSLMRFLDHHQVGRVKYKEGLTVAWLTLVDNTMRELPQDLPLTDVTNIILERLGDSSLIPTSAGELSQSSR
ncbi:MAG TPA: hypothetical protein VGW36_03580 [Pyrinomonadaceae bacterium]|nr:hypothetical protein [Pyrinomonadaceae bacterium]